MNVREIAKLAGVSIATVSRVINRPEAVLPEKREQVLAVMRKYNYHPWTRQVGDRGRSSTIGLLVPRADDRLAIRMLDGVESVASRRGCTVYLCGTRGDAERERGIVSTALAQGMEGLIILTETLDVQTAAELRKRGVPFVLSGRSEAARRQNACYINYEEGGCRMVRHLLELGRKNIVLLCGADAPGMVAQMCAGARRALGGREARVVQTTHSGIAAGYEAADAVCAGSPDAVFASSDELALGLMRALRERRVDVPEQVAVAGFTDLPSGEVVVPALTTVEQPAHRLGMVAARMLFDFIDDGELLDGIPQEIVLVPKLKVRNSCGNRKPINTLFE